MFKQNYCHKKKATVLIKYIKNMTGELQQWEKNIKIIEIKITSYSTQ